MRKVDRAILYSKLVGGSSEVHPSSGFDNGLRLSLAKDRREKSPSARI